MKNINTPDWKALDKRIRKSFKNHQQSIQIKDTPEYPLAFNVETPGENEHGNSHIGFRFKDFSWSGINQAFLNTGKCRSENNKVYLSLSFPKIGITGKYAINAKPAPVIKMDTAGNMMEFEDQPMFSAAAGADSGAGATTITPQEQDAFIDNARAQREQLYKSGNGTNLMSVFDRHNEVFNELFIVSDAARNTWVADGATAQMAKDTHQAVQPNNSNATDAAPVVNPADKLYAGNKTYNSNAFIQQLNVVVNTVNIDPNFNPWDPDAKPDPDSKYTQASLAALSFGKTVNTTGNSESQVIELNKHDVYGHVEQFNQKPPESSVDELQNIIAQGNGAGGADEAAEKGWWILTEEHRKYVRHWMHAAINKRTFDQNVVSSEMWSGNCNAVITDVNAEMEIVVEPAEGQMRVSSSTVNLPVFEFAIDDAGWNGKAAGIVRERLSQIYFVKSLIYSQVKKSIESMLNATVPALLKA